MKMTPSENPEFWIPPRTRERLANPAPEGHRHNQMLAIATSLIGQGLHQNAVRTQLREMFPKEGDDPISGTEIDSIVRAAEEYAPEPCFPSSRPKKQQQRRAKSSTEEATHPVCATDSVTVFLDGFRCSSEELGNLSPIRISEAPAKQAIQLLEVAFQPDELINIVASFGRNESGKPFPKGFGRTICRSEWVRDCFQHSAADSLDFTVPKGEAGTWIRINPLDGKGIGNANVVAHRHLLLEFDALPLDLQLSFFARIQLPITAILTSGGRSLHAWVKVDATDYAGYREQAGKLYEFLAPFREKCEPARESYQNEAMARGTMLEPEARHAYIERTGIQVFPACLQSNQHEWLRASVDGISADGSRAVEIKCGESVYRRAASCVVVPDAYYGQLQHIMAVAGLVSVDFWCYLPNREPVVIRAQRDNDYIERMILVEFEFWSRVQRSL